MPVFAPPQAALSENLRILFGPVPFFVKAGRSDGIVVTGHVDDAALLLALRIRLLQDESLWGRPLWRAVNSIPGLNASSSDDEIRKGQEHAMSAATWRALVLIRAELICRGILHKPVDLETTIATNLSVAIKKLRFCATCATPFVFGRKHKLTCGRPSCKKAPKPRIRPRHAAVRRDSRWTKFVAELRAVSEADRGLDIQALAEGFRAGNPHDARKLLEYLEESAPDLASFLESRLTRYRSSELKRRRMTR